MKSTYVDPDSANKKGARNQVFLSTVQSLPTSIKQNKLQDLEYYKKNAIRFLNSKKICNKFGTTYTQYILKSEDLIADVVFAFIKADMQYDPIHKASKATFRYKAGIWVIQKYIKQFVQQQNYPIKSLNVKNDDEHVNIKTSNFLDYQVRKELSSKTKSLCKLPCLTKREQDIMDCLYFKGNNMKELAVKHHISKARIGQIAQDCLKKIRQHIGTDKNLTLYWQDIREYFRGGQSKN